MMIVGKKLSCPCPLCNSTALLLKGSTKRRYFCIKCCIEFATDEKGTIKEVSEINSNGDLDQIKDWQEYIMYK